MIRLAGMVLLPLTACAGSIAEGPATPPVAQDGPCRNEPVAGFVGQKVTAELGTQMLKLSGATMLRWGGPGMAMTMDFRADRLTVSYDDQMLVTSARCG